MGWQYVHYAFMTIVDVFPLSFLGSLSSGAFFRAASPTLTHSLIQPSSPLLITTFLFTPSYRSQNAEPRTTLLLIRRSVTSINSIFSPKHSNYMRDNPDYSSTDARLAEPCLYHCEKKFARMSSVYNGNRGLFISIVRRILIIQRPSRPFHLLQKQPFVRNMNSRSCDFSRSNAQYCTFSCYAKNVLNHVRVSAAFPFPLRFVLGQEIANDSKEMIAVCTKLREEFVQLL